MRANLALLAQYLRPITATESSLMSAFEWLAQGRIPDRLREQLLDRIEAGLAELLPKDQWEAVKGCRDVTRYRRAFEARPDSTR